MATPRVAVVATGEQHSVREFIVKELLELRRIGEFFETPDVFGPARTGEARAHRFEIGLFVRDVLHQR